MMNKAIKAAFWIVFASMALLMFFGTLSFFFEPHYEKGTWAVIGAAVMIASNTLSFLFGSHVPKVEADPGTQTTEFAAKSITGTEGQPDATAPGHPHRDSGGTDTA